MHQLWLRGLHLPVVPRIPNLTREEIEEGLSESSDVRWVEEISSPA